MKNNYNPKKNNGVSMIALIITIVILIIIASIVISSFLGTSDKATSAKVLNEFIEVENAVAVQGKLAKIAGSNYQFYGEDLSASDKNVVINGITYNKEGYYLLTKDDLIMLGVNSSSSRFVVNYDTGEVIAVDPFIINNKKIYTKMDLIYEETDYQVAGIAEYDETRGVNKPILYNGMIPVKRSENSWVVCSKDDPEWYDYVVAGDGPIRYANAMLLDDTELINPSNNKTVSNYDLRNKKISEFVGYQVKTEGSMFIWVPRYTYKDSTDEIAYSKLTSDFLIQGYEKASSFHNGVVAAGSEGEEQLASGKELTGIWISKYQASYAN